MSQKQIANANKEAHLRLRQYKLDEQTNWDEYMGELLNSVHKHLEPSQR